MDWLSAASSFISIVDNGSFAEAARKKYSTSSALSKQIAWLEDRLGSKLLFRTTRQLSLTESGKQFYQRSKQIIHDIEVLKSQIHDINQEVSGKIRITCPITTQHARLVKLIPDFLKLHPKVSIELISCPKIRNLFSEGFDLAIRRDPSDDPALSHEYLGAVQAFIYASPDYLTQRGIPEKPQDLTQHNCLLHNSETGYAQWYFNENEMITVKGNYQSNDLSTLLQAAIQGLGLLYVNDYLVSDYVEKGMLVPVLEDYTSVCTDIYAVFPKQAYQPRAVSEFLSYLLECGIMSAACKIGHKKQKNDTA